MKTKWATKLPATAAILILASALTVGLTPAFAQKHGGGGAGGAGSGGAGMDRGDQIDSGHSGGKGGQRGGQGMGRGGSGGQSLQDIFRDVESGSSATSEEHGSGSSKKGGSAATSRGKRGSATTTTRGNKGTTAGKKSGKTKPAAAEEEESDRPPYAGTPGPENKPGSGGNAASGTKRGDIFGDMYVLKRDDNGVPILNEKGFVQPIDASGNVILQDAEGNLVNPELAIPVDLGRLNVGRSSLSVLEKQYESALTSINNADSISLDAGGRLVLTKDGVSSAIDSPLENLAIYKVVMTTGTLTGLSADAIAKLTSSTNDTLKALATSGITTADLTAAASFLGAASDKSIPITVDTVIYMNTILGINTKTDAGTITYFNYSTYNYTFDPAAVYGSTTVNVLTQTTGTVNGTETTVYVPTTVPVYQTLFPTESSASLAAGIAEAADDARIIIQYVHDNSIATE